MSQPIETVANYYLQYDQNDRIADQYTDVAFPADVYSRMKYGSHSATNFFASQLADRLAYNLPQLIEDAEPPEFLVAYKAVPPACYYLSALCLESLNDRRAAVDNEPGFITQVYKDRVTGTNYAMASSQERQAELDDIGFSLPHSINNTPAVILDDIRITGGAEKKILEVLDNEKPSIIALGYIAIFDPAQAVSRPSVEMELNSTTIQSIDDLLPLIKTSDFDLNIRTLKMMLSSSEVALDHFLRACPAELVGQIHRGTQASGETFVAHYRETARLIAMHAEYRGVAGV
ncbi:MAG TPA: phosphoribosyltransferase family protein [Candidatus Saccharimonadales bacterium]|nr:phosphoribosyltransferase family protein [Candidatus Saccharimonadales bacterium]